MECYESHMEQRSVMAPDIVERFTEEAKRFTIAAYTTQLMALYQDTAAHDKVIEPLLGWFDPPEEHFRPNASRTRSTAFYAGGLMGLRVVDFVGGRELMDDVGRADVGVRLNLSMNAEAVRTRHAKSLVRAGMNGYVAIKESYEQFHRYLYDAMPEGRRRIYLKSGFGLILAIGHGALEHREALSRQANRMRMREYLRQQPNTDWDVELRQLYED